MAIEVRIPTILRTYTDGAKAVDGNGDTLQALIDDLEGNHPGIKERLVESGDLRRFVNVYINDEDVRFIGGLEAELDPGKLDQVLSNLLSNAIKYSPTGTVTTVSLEAADDHLELKVADQGLGIPEAERPGVFRPYGTSATRATGGETSTGLGLAIVQRIVEEHRGTIDLESEVGVGTTFRIRLPRRLDI